jgi:hypothetical protein
VNIDGVCSVADFEVIEIVDNKSVVPNFSWPRLGLRQSGDYQPEEKRDDF